MAINKVKVDKEAVKKALGGKTLPEQLLEPGAGGALEKGVTLSLEEPAPKITPDVSPDVTPNQSLLTDQPGAPAPPPAGGFDFPRNQTERAEWLKLGRTYDPITKKWTKAGTVIPPEAEGIGAFVPATDAGKDFQQYVGSVEGKGLTEVDIKSRYRGYGLEDSLGVWIGSKAQWTSLLNAQKAQDKANVAADQQIGDQSAIQDQQDIDGFTAADSVNATGENVQMNVNDFGEVMNTIIDNIGTTDIATLIKDFAGGTLTTPETVLSEEDREAQLEQVKSAASAGLQTIQKNLAKRGMTFSGIRTQAEADLAADTLAASSGINKQFAARLVNAARAEQSRRETAINTAQQNYNKSLEAQGYQYNPFTDTIEKTLARQQFEFGAAFDVFQAGQAGEPPRPNIFGTEKTGYYQQFLNADGQWETQPLGISAPSGSEQTDQEFIDEFMKITGDSIDELQQGADWGLTWNRVKLRYPTIPNEVIDHALGGGIDNEQIIQDPTITNQSAPIPNPNYGKPWGWARQEAFNEFKRTGPPELNSKTEREASIWAWMNTQEFRDMNDEQVKAFIRDMGLDPATFGYGF